MKRILGLTAVILIACSSGSDTTSSGAGSGRNTTGPLGLSPDCASCAQAKCTSYYSSCTGNTECVQIGTDYCSCVCEHKGDMEEYEKCFSNAGAGHQGTQGGMSAIALYTCLKANCPEQCDPPDVLCGCPATNSDNGSGGDKDVVDGSTDVANETAGGQSSMECYNCLQQNCKEEFSQCQAQPQQCNKLAVCAQSKCKDECPEYSN